MATGIDPSSGCKITRGFVQWASFLGCIGITYKAIMIVKDLFFDDNSNNSDNSDNLNNKSQQKDVSNNTEDKPIISTKAQRMKQLRQQGRI